MNKINFVISPNMKNYCHGFFTKKGGVSKGIYESLNCGKSSKDTSENIIKNRKIISRLLSIKYDNLLIANQFHSNKVAIVNKMDKNIKCDGMISTSKDISLGVLTADCCPILIAHRKNFMIGVIHLGWKGLFNNILENFFNKCRVLKLDIKDLIFALGPCIGQESYQVSLDFKKKFVKNDINSKEFFKIYEKKCFFDIRGYAKLILLKLGSTNIWCSKHNTYSENNMFFSYRYSKHNNYLDYGRMLSVIKN